MRRTTRNSRHEARRSSNKEISALIQKARTQGWTVLYSGGGHLIFRSPDKSVAQVALPSTPGGGNRAIENATAKLKRSGLVMNRRRRSLRRNPSTGMLFALGAGVAIAAAFMLRGSTTISSAGMPTTTIPGVSSTDMAAAFRARREQSIAMLMSRGTMTRAQAEALFDRTSSAVVSSMHGIGSYYRS